jgi:hypothetical protein
VLFPGCTQAACHAPLQLRALDRHEERFDEMWVGQKCDLRGEGSGDVFEAVRGRVPVEVKVPLWVALTGSVPGLGGDAQGSEQLFLHLAVPGQELLGGARAPAQVNEVVEVGFVQPTLFCWARLAEGEPGYFRLPMGDVGQCILLTVQGSFVSGRGTGCAHCSGVRPATSWSSSSYSWMARWMTSVGVQRMVGYLL